MRRHTALQYRRAGGWSAAEDHVTLEYEARFLRRKVLTTDAGDPLFVDLPETVSLNQGDAFLTTDGAFISVAAAPELLHEVTAAPGELVRLAWHIGNRHTPLQIEPARLLVERDHVIAEMLGKLGATVREVVEPFTPEGGAYGVGRTHSHAHSHDAGHPAGHAYHAPQDG